MAGEVQDDVTIDSNQDAPSVGRFALADGALVSSRYEIVREVGRGGMGVVAVHDSQQLATGATMLDEIRLVLFRR